MNAKDAAQDSLDVAIHDGCALVECVAGNGAGGVAADAGQGEQLSRCPGELPVESFDDLLGRAVQVAGTRVVAEPLPQLEDRVEPGAGEALDRRESLQESLVVGHDRRDLRLLEHDLGDPDRVRVFGLSPGQITPVLSEPAEKGLLYLSAFQCFSLPQLWAGCPI